VNWALALLSAALLALSFPRYNLFWLAPVALAPLIIATARERRPGRRFLMGWSAGIVYWFTVCNWIQSTIQQHGGMSAAAAWFCFMLFCLAKALQMGAFAWLAGWTMRWRLAIPSTAALWVLIEYTHGYLGFEWLNLGNAAIDMGLPIRLASITGVWGISFLFAAIAADLSNFALRRPGIPFLGIGLIPLLWLLPGVPAVHAAPERATLVQPNIDETEIFTSQSFRNLVQRMDALSVAAPSKLLVWPESPAPFYDNDPQFMAFLESIAKAGDQLFLVGLIGHGEDGVDRNSAALIDEHGRVVSRYDKVNLVPFGEFVPWPLGPIAFKISKEAGDLRAGTEQVVSSVDRHNVATFICYESVFPRFISRFVKDGAEVLINPSNDGWFAKTAARYQHLEIVRMRAAENRRWILRATNDGISAAIDDVGRVRQELPLYREASQVVGFAYEKQLTFYTRWGDWFVWFCGGLLAAAWISHAGLPAHRHP
jgi:apolipoprotein N-acyltransferase